MNTDLAGKVVLITGASGGIGAAIARRFAEEGAKLILHYRNSRPEVESLARELSATETLIARADLTKEADTRRLFAGALKRFGRIDTLVANAGSWETRDIPLHEMSLKQWKATQDAVATSAFLSLREFLKQVAIQRRGNAVLVASTAGVFGEAGHADYAAAKSALAYGLTRSVKNEIVRIAPHTKDYCGGRVNCVCPGWTVVPRTAPKLKNTAIVKRVTATMSLPQIGRPDDMAYQVVFLASDSLSRHVTGQTIVVAGGMEGRLLWRDDEIDPSIV
jgi:3-oxoacyl-[acyl-carrier protein] reductase